MTIRRVRNDDSTCAAMCVVGTAAGPLPGDDISLEITALANARVRVCYAGASVAQGSGGPPARLRTSVTAGEDASVIGSNPPLVVAAGAAVDSQVSFDLAPTATLEWSELLVLGRSGEQAGAVRWSWNAVVGGRALLRQTVVLDRIGAPLALAGARLVASTLLLAPDLAAQTVVLHERAVAARLADTALLLTVLGADAASVSHDLARLRALCIRTAPEGSFVASGPAPGRWAAAERDREPVTAKSKDNQ